MATKTLYIYTEKEKKILKKAANDFIIKNDTDMICPRCGGEFIFDVAGSSFQLRCETDGCLTLTCRGI